MYRLQRPIIRHQRDQHNSGLRHFPLTDTQTSVSSNLDTKEGWSLPVFRARLTRDNCQCRKAYIPSQVLHEPKLQLVVRTHCDLDFTGM